MNKYSLLDSLYQNAPDFVSGEVLSGEFQISRTTIWKTVKELKKDGYDIESMPKNGYKLVLPNDIMSKYELSRRLGDGYNIEFFETLPSTNNYAGALAENGAPHNTIVVANSQSSGKAIKHGDFFSPANTGIYMSIILRPQKIKISSLPAFKQTITQNILHTINEVTNIPVTLSENSKLISNGKKLGGILTQASIEVESKAVEYLIVGIGLYVNDVEFPPQLSETNTSLYLLSGSSFNRADIIHHLATHLAVD